eukprot:1156221-Pelagomonas_calceolata.AAC.6
MYQHQRPQSTEGRMAGTGNMQQTYFGVRAHGELFVRHCAACQNEGKVLLSTMAYYNSFTCWLRHNELDDFCVYLVLSASKLDSLIERNTYPSRPSKCART